jgi:hypothetical protein
MAERMIKTIKHGITVLPIAPENVECWDEHLAKVMFGYKCGIQKVKLTASIHKSVLFNVEQAQQKQRKTYATRKGKQVFEGLITEETMVRMKKPGKKRALTTSWEGPYQFIGYADGKENLDFEEGNRVCIIQDTNGRQWKRSRRDL